MAETPPETVEPETDWTLVLSGPLARKAPLLGALKNAGCDLSEKQQEDPGHWPRQYRAEPDPTVGWVHVRHTDINDPALIAWDENHKPTGIVNSAGWRLVAHWPTPNCRQCSGLGKANGPAGLGDCLHCAGKGVTNLRAPDPAELLRADLDQMRAEIAALKARAQ